MKKPNFNPNTLTISKENVKKTNGSDILYLIKTEEDAKKSMEFIEDGGKLTVHIKQYNSITDKRDKKPARIITFEIVSMKKLGIRSRTINKEYYRYSLDTKNYSVHEIEYEEDTENNDNTDLNEHVISDSDKECINLIEDEIVLLGCFSKIKHVKKYFRKANSDELWLPWTYAKYDLEGYKKVSDYIVFLYSEIDRLSGNTNSQNRKVA